jgi:hypothetical protein
MRFFRLLAFSGLWIFTVCFGAHAQVSNSVQPEERAAVRSVIEGQLLAFAADDADGAFSFASQNIQEMFITARNFMSMVRTAYPVVYRPAGVSFQVPVKQGDDVWQAVQMRDSKGVDWVALYNLQRQANGAWKINGCVLQQGTDQPA